MDVQANMRLLDLGDLFATGSVTINKIFTIHEVRVTKIPSPDGEKKLEIFLPRKWERDHWKPVFEVSKEMKKAIDTAVGISLKEAALIDVCADELSVSVVPFKKGDLLGYASLTYQDAFTIDNIRIYQAKTKEEIRLVYPYSLNGEQFHPLFQINGRVAEDDITWMIKRAYEEKIRQKEPMKKERAR